MQVTLHMFNQLIVVHTLCKMCLIFDCLCVRLPGLESGECRCLCVCVLGNYISVQIPDGIWFYGAHVMLIYESVQLRV